MERGTVPARQRTAVERLVQEGVLSAEQGEAVLGALADLEEPAPPGTRRLVEVVGALGGALLLAGGVLLLGASWDDLGRAGRVTLLGAATVLLAVTAIVIAGGPRALPAGFSGRKPGARPQIVAMLLALAAVTTALTVGAAVSEYEASIAGVAGVVAAVLGYVLVPAVPQLFVGVPLSIFAAIALVGDLSTGTSLHIGGGLLALAALWALAARVVPHPEVALTAGVAIGYVGAQILQGQEGAEVWSYVLTASLAAACFAGYRVTGRPGLLVGGIVGVALVVPEVIQDWTGGAVSGAVLVLIAGAILLAGAVLLYQRRRRGSVEH